MTIRNNNLCSLLDAISFITEQSEELKGKESSNISDPLILSRTIFRRLLRKIFPEANIRKNKENYTVRLDDEKISKAFMVYNGIKTYSLLSYTDEAFRNDIQDFTTIMASLDAKFSRTNRYNYSTYRVADDNKFFMYFGFLPFTPNHSFNNDETFINTFKEYGLSKRISSIKQIAAELPLIIIPPIVDKLAEYFRRFGYGISYKLRDERYQYRFNEHFMDYILAISDEEFWRRGMSNIVDDYIQRMQTLNRDKEEQEVANESNTNAADSPEAFYTPIVPRHTINFDTPATPVHPVTLREVTLAERNRVRLIPIAENNAVALQNTVALQNAVALQIEQELSNLIFTTRTEAVWYPNDEDEPVEEGMVEEATEAEQNLFQNLLRRVVTPSDEDTDNRFFRLNIPDNVKSIKEQVIDDLNNFILAPGGAEIMIADPKSTELINFLPIVKEDVCDDIDTELDGLYFSLKDNNDLTYSFYREGELLEETEDFDEIVSKYYTDQPLRQIKYI